MKYIDTEKTIIKSWCNNPEEGCIEQAKHLANLPFVFKQICLMPDTHQGYGMPIGGVIATHGVVIPNAVGVDIGCGMCAVKTSLTEITTDKIKEIMGEIRKVIPLGFEHHKEKQNEDLMPRLELVRPSYIFSQQEEDKYPIIKQQYQSALKQLGTLGGGNHFIEIQNGSDGFIWIMIHSGSRNIGKQVADHYNKIARELNDKWYSSVPKEWDLAFLPIETEEAKCYMREMQYCLDFALANRKLMMTRITDAFRKVIPSFSIQAGTIKFKGTEIEVTDDIINIHHNYAIWENHFGQNVIIHRKGATSAREGEVGLIPGSQGSCSYIVKGKGNPDSFMSCSHGAGRKMGRKEACRSLNLQDEIKKLEDKGIIHAIRGKNDLEEATGSYKDIEEVMSSQSDLVEILIRLEPIAVIKG